MRDSLPTPKRVVVAILTAMTVLALVVGTANATSLLATRSSSSTPTRAAQFIGAHVGPNAQEATQFAVADPKIGPLQTDKFFYGTLPATYAGSQASQLKAGVVEIIAYDSATTNVVSFVQSIPANRQVLLVYIQEVEDKQSNGPAYVAAFEAQAALIRSAHRSNVQVTMDSASSKYGPSGKAVDGSFLPPASDVDVYCLDVYQHHPDGNGLRNDANFQGWLKLVQSRGKPLCIAEYGVNSSGQASGPESNAIQLQTLKNDNAYLTSLGNFEVWDYWWSLVGAGGKMQTLQEAIANHSYWQFQDPTVIAEWKSIEAGTNGPPPTSTTSTVAPTTVPVTTSTTMPVQDCSGLNAIQNVAFVVDGRAARALNDGVHQGSTVQVTYRLKPACASTPIGLASYQAPSNYWDPTTADQQVLFDSQDWVVNDTQPHTLHVTIPNCDFQVDLFTGYVDKDLAAEIGYHVKDRLIAAVNGGGDACWAHPLPVQMTMATVPGV